MLALDEELFSSMLNDTEISDKIIADIGLWHWQALEQTIGEGTVKANRL